MRKQVLLYGVMFSTLSSASILSPIHKFSSLIKDSQKVGSISSGPVWQSNGNTQTFFLAPDIVKTFAAKNNTSSLAEGEFFAGLQKDLPRQLTVQFGFLVATTGNATLKGNIWDDADPNFNNYAYSYNVRNTRLSAKGKLLLDKSWPVMPWISCSLGVGFNQAHNYVNVPTIAEADPIANFASNTTTAFTYTFGAGIQKSLGKHIQIGIGYEFADWGKSQLERQANQALNSGLTLNHLYTNGFIANLTFFS